MDKELLITLSAQELAYEVLQDSPLYESFSPLCLNNSEIDTLAKTLAPALIAKARELVNERVELMKRSVELQGAA